MNGPRRANESGITGSAVKNTVNTLKVQSGKAAPIKNTVGMKPKNTGYAKIKGAVSG